MLDAGSEAESGTVGLAIVCGFRPAGGGDIGGMEVVDASSLGRNAELISPIPTKKSSEDKLVTGRFHRSEILTWDDFHEIGTPFPDIRAIVNDDDHRRVHRK